MQEGKGTDWRERLGQMKVEEHGVQGDDRRIKAVRLVVVVVVVGDLKEMLWSQGSSSLVKCLPCKEKKAGCEDGHLE